MIRDILYRILQSHFTWIVWLILIFVAVGLPGDSIKIDLTFLEWLQPDKIVHFIMFGGLSFFMLSSFHLSSITFKNNMERWMIIIFSVFISGLTEYLQDCCFVGRDGNWFDFIADVLGVFIGLIIFNWLSKKWKLKESINEY